jgi:16S rRNA (cytidine1402-2'-O)-methyltransferase
MGVLYLVSTPVGNLEDLSPRAVRILGEVAVVLAEDTRHSGALLRHLGISTRLLSLHAHNEAARIDEVLRRLDAGDPLALVSDAGTPLVSDPGERLVARLLAEGHQVVPIPGPSAVLHALVGSGFPSVPFTFLGFLPRKGRERTERLERIASSFETIVLFESPERTVDLLKELEKRCGPDRRVAVARELTKVHEEFRRGTLAELLAGYGDTSPRGEVTVVIAPAEGSDEPLVDEEAVTAMALSLIEEGMPPSAAAKEVAKRLGIPRNRAYDLVQTARNQGSSPDSDLALAND